ncbi:peptide/nickel transport system permease protein [Arthrobacter ginsengisoli]|uniref:Peptide/nickel transport system permease protein n=1 Tax=Arthrobacter ginsengisoli TaxID=1356565 RepID=A0ABU1UG81_9MICC|nr:peptide/nickel transport system permease protein [Arthrobacter ginsengisoli]
MSSLALLVMVSAITFFMILLVPGDPAMTAAGPEATEQQIEETRQRLGLHDNVVVQFGRWILRAISGDLGSSLQGGTSVSQLISERFPVTLGLALTALSLAVIVAVPAAIIAAANRGKTVDRLITLVASAGVAIPTFWLGLMLVVGFSLYTRVLPSSGYSPFWEDPAEWLRYIIMPAVTLAAAPAAEIARQLRGSMIGVLEQDYVRTATAKGLLPRVVLLKHALKNAGVPAMTVIGLQATFLLGGSLIVEQIFGIPGLGALSINAVLQRDIPVIQGAVLVAGIAVLIVNLLVDLSYRTFNPKVR